MVKLSKEAQAEINQRAERVRQEQEAREQFNNEVEAIAQYQAGVVAGFCGGYQYPLERMIEMIRESYQENKPIYDAALQAVDSQKKQ